MTALGGLQVMNGGLTPATPLGWRAAAAVLMSAVNVAGGFVMTGRMLNMFTRPTDPKPHMELFGIPLLLTLGGYAACVAGGLAPPALHVSAGLASALCCIGAIGGLSSQKTARAGNALGVIGVSLGIAATLGALVSKGISSALATQMGAVLAVGGALGLAVAQRCAITDLPQLVAAFHSLVGLAAAITGVVSFAAHGAGRHHCAGHAARRAHDDGHRRRGHARGDHGAQQLQRLGAVRGRLRAVEYLVDSGRRFDWR